MQVWAIGFRAMGLWAGVRVLLALPALLFAGAAAQGSEWLQGMPEVVDGDTLVLQGARLQLVGIDAPELEQICVLRRKSYDCGDIARSALLNLIAGSEVACKRVESAEAARTDQPAEEYWADDGASGDRALCTVDGYDLSEGMVYTGWALTLPFQQTRYSRFQTGARAAKRGLWRGAFVTPWDWRDGKRLAFERDGKE